MSSNNKPGAASASSSNSASSAGSGAARGKGGKGERGGKGGKVAKGGKGRKGGNDVTPISASSDAVAASNVALVKVFTENSAGFVVLEHEGPNGQLLADIRELARKMHAAGNSAGARILLEAHTTAIMGLSLEGRTQEARLRGTVTDEVTEESTTNSKILVLAKAIQGALVQLDGLSVMVATATEKISVLTEKVMLLSGASLNGQPAQCAQASAAVPTAAKSPGATPAAGRRLKKFFINSLLQNPLRQYRGLYNRQKAGLSYSHHGEGKIAAYVRELQLQDPSLFGGVSVDSILAADSTDDKVVPKWTRWYGNARSKYNASIGFLWKTQDVCTRRLGIRDTETPESAMAERLIELSTMAYKLRNVVTPSELIEWDECEDLEDYMSILASNGINWEMLAYICLLGGYKHMPEVRSMGDSLTVWNPLHGTLYWFIVKEFLIYSVKTFHFDIPGLSSNDGEEGKLSSLATIEAIATAKIDALTAACMEQDVAVPDYSQFYFQEYSGDSAGDEGFPDGGEDSLDGSDGDEGEDGEEDEDEEDAGQQQQPKQKRAKVRAM